MASERLERALEHGLTVAELIEALQDLDQEAKVVFAYNYGDHWRTQVAGVVEQVEAGAVAYSDYHSMPKVVEGDDAYDTENVVILGG